VLLRVDGLEEELDIGVRTSIEDAREEAGPLVPLQPQRPNRFDGIGRRVGNTDGEPLRAVSSGSEVAAEKPEENMPVSVVSPFASPSLDILMMPDAPAYALVYTTSGGSLSIRTSLMKSERGNGRSLGRISRIL